MVRRCRPLLGTFVEVSVPAGHAAAIDAAFGAIQHVHERMSFHEETSDLAMIRRSPPGEPIKAAAETVEVLAVAIELHRKSKGVFDISVGRFLVASGFLPRPPGIDLRKMTGTTADIEIVDDRHIACHKPMLIDLGGIAKGYAVDRAVEALRLCGAPCGIVNAGGDLRTFGNEAQTVHLRGATGALDDVVELADMALASSSNRHLRRTCRGQETSPHMDGHGRPVLASHAVTVMAPTCTIADALTKVALVDPTAAGLLLRSLGGKVLVRAAEQRAA